MPAKELESSFEIAEMVPSLLQTSKSLGFLSFWSFVKARGDLDRSAVNEVMDSIKRKVREENLTDRT